MIITDGSTDRLTLTGDDSRIIVLPSFYYLPKEIQRQRTKTKKRGIDVE